MARKWTRAARNIFSSLADIAGDWLFWQYTVRGNAQLDKYEIPVLAFAGVSSLVSSRSTPSTASTATRSTANANTKRMQGAARSLKQHVSPTKHNLQK